MAQAGRKFPLMGIALRGLAKFAHQISVDYFQDILTLLLKLLQGPGLPLPLRLTCLLTASDMLRWVGA